MPKVHWGVGRLEFSGAQQRLKTLSTSSLCHLGNTSDCKLCFSQSHSANSKFASDFGSFFLLWGKSLVYGTLTSSPFHCRAELGLNAAREYKSHLQWCPRPPCPVVLQGGDFPHAHSSLQVLIYPEGLVWLWCESIDKAFATLTSGRLYPILWKLI